MHKERERERERDRDTAGSWARFLKCPSKVSDTRRKQLYLINTITWLTLSSAAHTDAAWTMRKSCRMCIARYNFTKYFHEKASTEKCIKCSSRDGSGSNNNKEAAAAPAVAAAVAAACSMQHGDVCLKTKLASALWQWQTNKHRCTHNHTHTHSLAYSCT